MLIEAPTVRLVWAGGGDKNAEAFADPAFDPKPAMLVAYGQLGSWTRHRAAFNWSDWVLDSGAFTAWTLGKPVVLEEYIADCHRVLEWDDAPTEIYALDVIGDPEATMRNVDAMLAAGIEAIPTFHFGSPWHYLEDIARKHRKIAIGGIAKLRGRKRREFVEQCFARTWPLRIHGFGVADRKLAFNYPFHSMDATNWRRPQKYGWYSDFGALRGSTCKSFRIEIRHYLQMQRDLRWRWREAMKEIEECPTT